MPATEFKGTEAPAEAISGVIDLNRTVGNGLRTLWNALEKLVPFTDIVEAHVRVDELGDLTNELDAPVGDWMLRLVVRSDLGTDHEPVLAVALQCAAPDWRLRDKLAAAVRGALQLTPDSRALLSSFQPSGTNDTVFVVLGKVT